MFRIFIECAKHTLKIILKNMQNSHDKMQSRKSHCMIPILLNIPENNKCTHTQKTGRIILSIDTSGIVGLLVIFILFIYIFFIYFCNEPALLSLIL